MKTFVLGSDHPGDQLAWDICEELGIEAEFTNEFAAVLPFLEIGRTIVIDVAKGIEIVQEVPIDTLKNIKTVTAHDFDFASELKLALAAKLFPPENLVIIGIPMGLELEEAKEQLSAFLQDFDGKTI